MFGISAVCSPRHDANVNNTAITAITTKPPRIVPPRMVSCLFRLRFSPIPPSPYLQQQYRIAEVPILRRTRTSGGNDFARQGETKGQGSRAPYPAVHKFLPQRSCGVDRQCVGQEVVGFKRLTPKCGAGPRRRLPLLSASGLVVFPASAGTFGASSGEPMTFKAGTLHLVLGKSGTFSEAALLFGQTISDSFLFNSPVARKFSRTGRRVLKDNAMRSKRWLSS